MKYQIKITSKKNSQAIVFKALGKLLNADKMLEVKKQIQDGVIIIRDLNEKNATTIANQLNKMARLGVTVEVTRMKTKETYKLYLVRLLSVGKSKLAVVKVVHETTELGLKESKTIVDDLGVVAEGLIKSETERIGKLLEAAGAKVRIEETSSSEPDPEDPKEPEPDPEDPNKEYLVRLLSVGKHELRVVKIVHELTKLGLKESKGVVDRLGVVAENLSKKEAERIGKLLEAAGAKVRVEEMSSSEPDPEDTKDPEPEPEDPNKEYLVRLLSVGKHELRLVKIVNELTKLGLKESKGVVDRLGVVAENLSKKEAERIGKALESAGAKVLIEEMSSPEPEQPESNVVSGRVFNSKGIQMPFASIVLVDKNVGKDIPLEKGQTEKDGSYKIQYKPKSSTDHPDIQVQLMADEKEKKQILAKSSVRYNAKPVEEHLDIVVPVEKLPKSDSEYNRLLTKLKDQLAVKTDAELGKILAASKEDDDQQDITYLANKTGWDARLIAMMALSHEKSITTDLPPALYYALYRAALPTGETAFFNTNVHTVSKIWKKAIEQNIIDVSWKDELGKYLDLFKKTGTKLRLDDETSAGVSTMNQMLSLSLKDDKQKQDFAERYFNQDPEGENFWEGIEESFGKDLKGRLQLDGKLGVLTLNNAPLIQKLRDQESITTDPIELVRNGFYKVSAWEKLIKEYEFPLPDELPGETDDDKQKVYAALMAQQLKASYPTAVLAAQINSGEEFTLADADAHNQVVEFLDKYQESFIIGQKPLIQFINEKELTIKEPVVKELKRLERLYQMSPSDEAMKVLSASGIDSAHAAVQMGEDVVVRKLVSGGLDNAQAQMVYAKCQQVQSTVLNVTTAIIAHKNTPMPYGLYSSGKQENANDNHGNGDDNDGIIGYPTLEGLFGEMDFCDCTHCRSVLSPAAYLVDLLNFIDKDPEGFDDRTGENPLDALLKRRPDIEHIQLTCENTNTVLPYIDLVNEILEYYTLNESLIDFDGNNNTGDRSTEELLANPQFVKKEAYEILKEQVYPFQLPFNQPLASIRRLFEHLEVPLSQAMQSLRVNDEEDTWANINMEYLEISPGEYNIFTQDEKSIAEYYGEKANKDLNVVFTKNNTFAKDFSRKLGVSYKELTRLVKTRFINPASNLIPKLESLKIDIHTILKFIDGNIDNNHFDALLPDELKKESNNFKKELFDGDVKAWLRDRGDIIKSLIFLVDRSGEQDECSFVQLELRRVNETQITDSDYFKFMRFIRFWKKLGWTIEQTDKTISALWPSDQEADTVESLNKGFTILINRTAHLKRVMTLLSSNPKWDLLKVLRLIGFIDTQAPQSLYKELFLNTSITDNDKVFSANSSVDYLTDEDVKILDHEPAVLAAFNLTSEKLRIIVERIMTMPDLSNTEQVLNDIEDVPLNMPNVSTIHRYAYLSRQLKLSIKELFILQDLTQVNPFDELEMINPSLIKFIELVQRLKQSSLSIPQLSYYLRHEDLSGEASPSDDDLLAITKQVNDALRQVENDYNAIGDVTGESVRSKMVLVYPQETVDQFFNIIKNELSFTEEYTHHATTLEDELQKITDRLSYNHFQKTLVYKGIMSDEELENLKTAADVITETEHRADFLAVIQVLYDKGQTGLQNLFTANPELEEPYNNFTVNRNFEQLLGKILAGFKKRLKKLAVIQTLSDALGMEQDMVATLLDNKTVLHASANSELNDPKNAPVIEDYLALETNGISAVYVFDDDSEQKIRIKNINSSLEGLEFPDTQAIKKVNYSFYAEIAEKAFYNFNLKTNNGAGVSLFVNQEEIVVSSTDETWENTVPIELAANRYHLIEIAITNSNSIDTAILKWATENKTSYRLLPDSKLYPEQLIQTFKNSYLRFLKASALLANLEMSQEEIRYFSRTFKINDAGFLNAIPTHFEASKIDLHQKLWQHIANFLDYQQLKQDLDVKDDELIIILDNPEATYINSKDEKKSLLLKTTNWVETDLDELLNAFSMARSDLSSISNFYKIWKAYQLVATSGLPAKTLLESTTNNPDPNPTPDADSDPDSDTVHVKTMKQALRLKYDTNAWLQVIQPINDALRNEQRDALVAYVLQLMQNNNHKTVDTADKLFEYFLIDVEMDSCMKTSRIKQAISSVQLFVQRALLNLEQQEGESFGVDPASINSKQWEWMKRYRVWEANRKVFISPENWLEPELRDNKSPFFKELESELLQSDITEDQARNVMLNYLEKLDDVAKLDIAGICLQENQKTKDGEYYAKDDVLHIFGKTQGTTTKYYYRRYEGGYFTPWEKVDLDIEGAPILPVIWKGRLFLFWLNIIQKGVKNDNPAVKSGGKTVKLMDANFDSSALEGNSNINVEINLSWSEYFNGKWQPRRMSDVEEPVVFENIEAEKFQRKNIKLFSTPALHDSNILNIQIKFENKTYLIYREFQLKNKYSALKNNFNTPIQSKIYQSWVERLPGRTFSIERYTANVVMNRIRYKYQNSIYRKVSNIEKSEIQYIKKGSWVKRINHFERSLRSIQSLFKKSYNGSFIDPRHFYSSPYNTAFFLQNQDHVFFVQLNEKWVPFQKNNNYGTMQPVSDPVAKIELTPVFEIPDFRQVRDPKLGFDPGYIDPVPPGYNFANDNIKIGLPEKGTIQFNGREIGAFDSKPQANVNIDQLFNQ